MNAKEDVLLYGFVDNDNFPAVVGDELLKSVNRRLSFTVVVRRSSSVVVHSP